MAGLAFKPLARLPNLPTASAGELGQARLRGFPASRLQTESDGFSTHLKAANGLLGSAAAMISAALVQRLAARRWRGVSHQRAKCVKVSLAAEQSSMSAAMEMMLTDITPEELQECFEIAGEGRKTVTFDEALDLDGVDGVLEEGATTEDELLVLWGGDDTKELDLGGFSEWYKDVLQLYDDFLTQGAVEAPLSALLNEDQESLAEAADEDLLEDRPSFAVDVSGVEAKYKRATQTMTFGSLNNRVPMNDSKQEQSALDWQDGADRSDTFQKYVFEPSDANETAGMASPGPDGRNNVELTALFRKATNDSNLLDFEGLKRIAEFEELLEDEELSEEELREMWDELPQQGGKINILAFRDLLAKVDGMFEFFDDKEDDENAIMKSRSDFDLAQRNKRNIKNVKEQMLEIIYDLLESEKKPLGLDGKEETHGELIRVCAELEDLWRDQAGDLKDWDGSNLCGDWELIYTTSAKFRRWQNLMNPFEKALPDCKSQRQFLKASARVRVMISTSTTWRNCLLTQRPEMSLLCEGLAAGDLALRKMW